MRGSLDSGSSFFRVGKCSNFLGREGLTPNASLLPFHVVEPRHEQPPAPVPEEAWEYLLLYSLKEPPPCERLPDKDVHPEEGEQRNL
jgi:hypothetical protein